MGQYSAQKPLRQTNFFSLVCFLFFFSNSFPIERNRGSMSSEMKLYVIAFLVTLVLAMVSAFPIEDGSNLEEVYKAGGVEAQDHEGAVAAYRAKTAESTEIDAEEAAGAAGRDDALSSKAEMQMDEPHEKSVRNNIGFYRPSRYHGRKGRKGFGYGNQYES